MQPRIAPQFRMERERNVFAVFYRDDSLIDPSKYLQVFSGPCDNRCPDKNRVERATGKSRYREIRFKGFPLPAKRIPIYRHVHQSQRADPGIIYLRCHQHHAGAGRKDTPRELPERFVQAVLPDEPGDGGRFAPGNGKCIALSEIGPVPDFKNLGGGAMARPLEREQECVDMLADISLEGKYPDLSVHGSGAPRHREAYGRPGRAWHPRGRC